MAGISMEDVDKYQKRASYLLIDIKIIFIITFVYISVVNLISTTANNEANDDLGLQFNVTSRIEHSNVDVDYIDDAVLWNCRERSLTSGYYITLYWMLLSVFVATLVFYSTSKFFALWNIATLNSLTDLWHMGIMQQLKKLIKETTYNPDDTEKLARCYRDLLSKKLPERFYNEMKMSPLVKKRNSMPYWSQILLVSMLFFSAVSYDLHPISCISGIPEDSIHYDNTTQTVELRFTGSVITFQRVGVFITFILFVTIILLARWFHHITRQIVDIMEVKVESEIKLLTV